MRFSVIIKIKKNINEEYIKLMQKFVIRINKLIEKITGDFY